MIIKPSDKDLSDFLHAIEESEHFVFLLKSQYINPRGMEKAMHLDGYGPKKIWVGGTGYKGPVYRTEIRLGSDIVTVTYAAEVFMEMQGKPWRKNDDIMWERWGADLSYQFLGGQQLERTDGVEKLPHIIDVRIMPQIGRGTRTVKEELGDYADRILYTPAFGHSWTETAK